MTSQLGTHYKGTILFFTSICKTSEMEGKLNLKTEEESCFTVLCCRQPNKVSCKNHSNNSWHFYAHFPKGGKTKTKMDDLRQDSQTGLPTKYFALCSEHFKASCFSRSVLIGTPVDFKRFYFEKGSVPSIYVEPKDSLTLDVDYPRNEERLANWFFPEKRSLDVSLRPYRGTWVSKSPPPPPPQKKNNDFFPNWVGLYAYSRYAFDLPRWQIHDLVHEDGPILESRRVQRRHAKLKPTTAAK